MSSDSKTSPDHINLDASRPCTTVLPEKTEGTTKGNKGQGICVPTLLKCCGSIKGIHPYPVVDYSAAGRGRAIVSKMRGGGLTLTHKESSKKKER